MSVFDSTLPRRLGLLLLLRLGSWLSGCENSALPESPSPRPAPSSKPAEASLELRQRFWQLTRRPPVLRDPNAKNCQTFEGEPRLVIEALDARADQRQLLPLSLLRPLETLELTRLRPYALDAHGPGELPAPPWRKLGPDLERLAQRRFKGVFQITLYLAPKRVYRVKRNKMEWEPGRVHAWLVIFDTQTSRALCQTRLEVKNDVEGLPLSRRRREETEMRLIRELGQGLQDTAKQELPQLAPGLNL